MHWLTEYCLLLQSDATYLVVTDDGQIEKYGLNAVCTHLGCVVHWNNVRALTASMGCAILRHLTNSSFALSCRSYAIWQHFGTSD